MISSVTTTTVSTISSTAVMASIGAIAALALIAFLVTKELGGASDNGGLRTLSRVLNIAIVPLFLVFSASVIARVVEVL